MAKIFNVATNLMGQFSLGWPDEPDNFYITGRIVRNQAMISCRILSAEGTVLFELINNKLTPRSLSIYRRVGFEVGWEICDENNYTYITLRKKNGISNIYGQFYDNKKNLVLEGTDKGLVLRGCPVSLG